MAGEVRRDNQRDVVMQDAWEAPAGIGRIADEVPLEINEAALRAGLINAHQANARRMLAQAAHLVAMARMLHADERDEGENLGLACRMQRLNFQEDYQGRR